MTRAPDRRSELASEARTPALVDSHVGARVRIRRKLLGVSQQQLADALGLTFQQVQKYERGSNRVSASKLYEIARFLTTPVAYFFEELPNPETGEGDEAMDADRRVHEFLRTAEGLELARLFPHIHRAGLRRSILELVRAAAAEEASMAASAPPAQGGP